MKKKIQLKLTKPYDLQSEIISHPARFKVVNCGRRTGKTVMVEGDATERAIKGQSIGFFSPTYKMLKQSWREITAALRPIIAEKNEQEKRLYTITKGSIFFWSLDSYDSIRGGKYHHVFVDEAAISPYLQQAWNEVIRPTLMDYKGGATFTSTPKAGFFKELFEKEKQNDTWKSWQLPTSVNPYIDKSEIEELRTSMPELVYRQEILAEFVDLQGGLLKRSYLKYYDNLPIDLDIVIGVDLAISQKATADYTCFAVLGKDSYGNIYIIDIVRERLTFKEIVDEAIRLNAKYQPRLMGIESVSFQQSIIQELIRTTQLPIRAITPKRGEDKQTRFLPLVSRYENGLVYHNKGLLLTFEDELLSFPESEHDDQVDAISYAYQLFEQQITKGILF